MGFFRFILATCIACILLAAVTLGGAILYSHNTDDPIIYRTYEDPDKIVIDVFDTQVIIEGDDFPGLPQKSDPRNAWTESKKAVTEPPKVIIEELDPLEPPALFPEKNSECGPKPFYSAIPPKYPEACIATADQMETVTVRFVVDEQGKVDDLEVADSTNDCFNEAALEAVQKWKYPPVDKKCNNRPSRHKVTTRLSFRLTE